eukprot:PhF_6_TR30458/c0_g1_i2/m.44739
MSSPLVVEDIHENHTSDVRPESDHQHPPHDDEINNDDISSFDQPLTPEPQPQQEDEIKAVTVEEEFTSVDLACECVFVLMWFAGLYVVLPVFVTSTKHPTTITYVNIVLILIHLLSILIVIAIPTTMLLSTSLVVFIYSHVAIGVLSFLEWSSSSSSIAIPLIIQLVTLVLEVYFAARQWKRTTIIPPPAEEENNTWTLLYQSAVLVLKGFHVYCTLLQGTLLIVNVAVVTPSSSSRITTTGTAWVLALLIYTVVVFIDIPMFYLLVQKQCRMSLPFSWLSQVSNLSMLILTFVVMREESDVVPDGLSYLILSTGSVVALWLNLSIILLTRQLPPNPEVLPPWFPMRDVVYENLTYNKLNLLCPFTQPVELYILTIGIGCVILGKPFSPSFLALNIVCLCGQLSGSTVNHLVGVDPAALSGKCDVAKARKVYLCGATITVISALAWGVGVSY